MNNNTISNFVKIWVNQNKRTPFNIAIVKRVLSFLYNFLNQVCCPDENNLIPASVSKTREDDLFLFIKTQVKNNTPNIKDVSKARNILLQYIDNCCYDLDEDTLYAYIVYGQSNGTGMGFQPLSNVNNVAFNGSVKIQWDGVDEKQLIVTPNVSIGVDIDGDYIDRINEPVEFVGDYNPSVIGSNELTKIISQNKARKIQFISINASRNGATTDDISSFSPGQPYLNVGSSNYALLLQAIQVAQNYAISIGKKFKVPFIVYVQGETEVLFADGLGLTTQIYYNQVINLIQNLNRDISLITGQTTPVYFFDMQVSWDFEPSSDLNARDMLVKQAQYELNNGTTLFAIYPSQQLSTLSGSGHYDNYQIFKWSQSVAKNIYYTLYEGKNYVFNVNSILKEGNQLVLNLNVPVPPIYIDTSLGITQNSNFYAIDILGNPLTITNVAVTGPDQITITFASTLGDGYIYYGWTKDYLNNPDTSDLRPGSFVVDSDSYVSSLGIPCKNYLLSFQLSF